MNSKEKNILIIGNGFDLAHYNIPKIEYKDFVKYLKDKKLNLSKNFKNKKYEEMFVNSSLWSEFENYCKNLNESKDKTRFYNNLIKNFTIWIDENFSNIDYKKIKINNFILNLIKKNNIYSIISFNYTNTPTLYKFEQFLFNWNTGKKDFDLISIQNKYLNIHKFNSDEKNFKYIIGSDNEKEKYNKNKYISKWNNKKFFNPKCVLFNELINNLEVKKIFFFGFSFGLSDKETILFLKKFIFGEKSRIIIIYYLDDESLKKIKENIQKEISLNFIKNLKFIKI